MNRALLFILFSTLAQVVTAAQTCRDAIPASTADSRFSVNGDEVADTVTGLIWQRCPLGQTGTDCSGSSVNSYLWQGALEAAEAERTATGKPWRLPSISELLSIVERRCFNPAINLEIFPNTPTSTTWSASPFTPNPSDVWAVNFTAGNTSNHSKSYPDTHVRLVRGGL